MMSVTHVAFSVAFTSVVMGTADPIILGVAALASQLPDVDTSRSITGQILLPVSRWLEERYPHRTITHSFLASSIVTLATYPLVLVGGAGVWEAIVLGYFSGWFADVFTKSGVAAFYPGYARLVVPGNPRLRLSTGSRAEVFVLAMLIAVALLSISINNNGGVLRTFNQVLGIPSGAVEIVNAEVSEYLLIATVEGRNIATQQPLNGDFEVIRPMTQSDLLVKDRPGKLYRVGTTQQCQIFANRILITRGGRIKSTAREMQLLEQEIAGAIAGVPKERTYISGTLILEDAEDLILPTYANHFNSLTMQPGREIVIVRMESASPASVTQLIGEYYASGNLIIRTVKIL